MRPAAVIHLEAHRHCRDRPAGVSRLYPQSAQRERRRIRQWRWWRRFLARFRLSSAAICEMSASRGLHDDYHDYPDSTTPYPWHLTAHICRRCGKAFVI